MRSLHKIIKALQYANKILENMRKINEQWVKKTPFYKFTYDSSVNNSFEKKKVIIYIKVFE